MDLPIEIAKYYGEAYKQDLKFISDKSINLASRTYTPRQFEKRIQEDANDFTTRFDNKGKAEFYSLADDGISKLSDNVFRCIIAGLKNRAVKEVSQVKNSDIFKGDNYSYKNHVLCIDVRTGDKKIYDKTLKEVVDLDVDEWRDWLRDLPKEWVSVIKSETIRGIIEYDPFFPESVTTALFNDRMLNKINAHAVTVWRKASLENPVMPSTAKDFFEFFFPHQESREFVMNWMYWMLTGRNETHLLLHGRKGVGKNTFAAICRQLVGAMHYKLIDVKFWESRFNTELKHRRLCFFDEHNITRDNIAQFKAYANPYLSIEEKGKNVERDIKNYASYIISNNDETGNYLDSDERRFSVPVIAESKLEHNFSKAWVEELVYSIDNDLDFIRNIGWWIIANGRDKRWDAVTPLKSPLFYKLVEGSMSEWQRKLINLLEQREYEEIDMSQLDIILDLKVNVGRAKVQRFLENHTDKDNNYYAEIKQVKSKRFIVPIGKYTKSLSDSPEEEELDDFGGLEF